MAASAGFPSPPPPFRRLQQKEYSFKGIFFLLVTSSVFFFFYSFSSFKLDVYHHEGLIHPPQSIIVKNLPFISHESLNLQVDVVLPEKEIAAATTSAGGGGGDREAAPLPTSTSHESVGSRKKKKNDGAFHDRALFMEDYTQMNKSMKIYAYPHSKSDPFANVLLPVDSEPGGNYASESYFKKALFQSHFLTDDPSEADLFYLPFSIASLRHDKRVGVGGIKTYVKNYVREISRTYPFWNRTGGADHFYVACHSVGRTAMEKAVHVKLNAIQVVCSSSYFLTGYITHKDTSIPQIWPRKGRPPVRPPSKRQNLAFYAGAMNSRVRGSLVKTWGNDTEISVHRARLKTPYSESLLGSKFCIHAKGFEVNTARIGDALYYGCVPVVLADHYDLPYADVLDWERFAVVLPESEIPAMKKVLREMVVSGDYLRLQENVVRVQRHFQWHSVPVDFDAFYMVMYELWLRRSHVRISI